MNSVLNFIFEHLGNLEDGVNLQSTKQSKSTANNSSSSIVKSKNTSKTVNTKAEIPILDKENQKQSKAVDSKKRNSINNESSILVDTSILSTTSTSITAAKSSSKSSRLTEKASSTDKKLKELKSTATSTPLHAESKLSPPGLPLVTKIKHEKNINFSDLIKNEPMDPLESSSKQANGAANNSEKHVLIDSNRQNFIQTNQTATSNSYQHLSNGN